MKNKICLSILWFLSLSLTSCQPIPGERTPNKEEVRQFGIYLADEEIWLDGGKDLVEIKLSEDPIIWIEDIRAYSASTHEISLTQSAVDRLSEIDPAGKTFVVSVGGERIYTGEFMAAYMSRTSDKAVILWPPMQENQAKIKIQLGYPGMDFFRGEDPRSDPRILEFLRNEGKLK